MRWWISHLCYVLALILESAAIGATRPNLLLVIPDNWGHPHAGIYGDASVKTPHFDRLAAGGMLFNNAFCVAPSCAPARSLLLTGRPAHQLEAGGNLWGYLPRKFVLYTDLLEQAGYAVGYQGKGWSPGDEKAEGRPRNPAGHKQASFMEFVGKLPARQPFCFWAGFVDTALHQWTEGAGAAAGIDPAKVRVPAYLPDSPEVRSCIADYYESVQRSDAKIGLLLAELEASGRAGSTLIVVMGDNGWQMPRGLANVHDSGTHVPLAIHWPGRIVSPGSRHEGFVDFLDIAPTFLQAAGLKPPPEMIGRSLLPLLEGKPLAARGEQFLERERHANVRRGDRGYPCRAIRTAEFLYIRNFEPELWAAGDPELYFAVGPYGDVDNSLAKRFILEHKAEPAIETYFKLNFAKRPAAELYDLRRDPDQIRNVAGMPEYAEAESRLRIRLEEWMKQTADPRAIQEHDDRWDKYPYYGGPYRDRSEKKAKKPAAEK